MKTYLCIVCGFVYDEAQGRPEEGIAAGTLWTDVPATWACPDCGVAKADFEVVEIVGRRDLHGTRTLFGICVVVADDGDEAAHQRQTHHLADEMLQRKKLATEINRVGAFGCFLHAALWARKCRRRVWLNAKLVGACGA